MTKLEKLEKEYRKAMLDLYMEDGSSEMNKALQEKCNSLFNQIQEERIRVAKRGRRK